MGVRFAAIPMGHEFTSLVLALLQAHRDAIQALAWSPDGRWLASGAPQEVMEFIGGETCLPLCNVGRDPNR